MYKAFLVSFFLFCSCSKQETKGAKPTILVSIAPYKKIVEKIAGDDFCVEVIVPEGANPHVYEPTPRDIQAIAKGSLWFQVGESFEKKVLPVLQEKRTITCVDLRESIEIIKGSSCKCDETGEDRHIWLSPRNIIAHVKVIQKTLKEHFPEKEFHGEALIADLMRLDQTIQRKLKKASHKSFLVAHPAFGYFCRDYGVSQLSIEHDGKEPTAKYLTHVIDTAKKLQTSVAICMPEHPSKGIEVIGEKLKLSSYTISPYSSNFLEEIERLATVISDE